MKLSAEQIANARIIASIARMNGVDPALAIATAWHESGLRNSATGDHGTSFGLFQLHQGGMLGSHSAAWARNPRNNAATAVRSLASYSKRGRYASPGALAAASQRPAAPGAYAASVNGNLALARQILRGRGMSVAVRAAAGRGGGATPPATLRPTLTMDTMQPLQPLQMPPITVMPATEIFSSLERSAGAGTFPGLVPSVTPAPAGSSALYDDLDAIRRRLLSGT